MVEVVNYMAKWLTDLNLLPADIERDEEELTYWKRQVVTACVYGVDVNPLAVELARLSLWLATISRDRPLSFLDHHVRLGNTLVGARIDQLTPEADTSANGQLPLWDVSSFSDTVRDAVGRMMTIEGTIAEAVTDVKAQEKSFTAIFDELEPWRKLAHVWTARHFGLDVSSDQWQALYKAITTDTPLSAELQTLLDGALRLHEEYHFFHWELAFPEVFFDEEGMPIPEGGFDAVVGNPPYVRMEALKPFKTYFQANYGVHSSRADLYLYFYECGLNLLRQDCRMGYITSGTYMNSNSAKPFRQYIHESAAFEKVINFGENQPFKGAEMVYPSMAIIRKGSAEPTFKSLFIDGVIHYNELPKVVAQPLVDTESSLTDLDEWRFQPIEITQLFRKITDGHSLLSEVVDNQIYRGVVTGLNDAFVIDMETRDTLIERDANLTNVIKPMLRGQDLRPWYHVQEEYLIFTYHGFPIDDFPVLRDYLTSFRESLEERSTSDNHEWYELQQPQMGIFHEFDKPKVFWPDIAKLPRMSFDMEGKYTNNKCYFITTSNMAILAILQSRVSWFAQSQIATPLRLRAGLWQYQLFSQFVERIPIPELTSTQEQQLIDYAQQITTLAQERYQLHEAFRHRVQTDIGAGGKLNIKLTDWYDLPDFSAFREEIVKSFGASNDIPLRERGDWEAYLLDELAKHNDLTQQIIALEIQLNAVVYEAFDLTPDEIALIEEATKYPYGAV